MSSLSHLPFEILIHIFSLTCPDSVGDATAWTSHAIDLLNFSLVNTRWNSAALDEQDRILIVNGTYPSFEKWINRLDAVTLSDEDSQTAYKSNLPPTATSSSSSSSTTIRAKYQRPLLNTRIFSLYVPPRSCVDFNMVLKLLLRLPFLKTLVLRECLDLDLENLVQLRDLSELHCIEVCYNHSGRTDSPLPTLQRLVLNNSLIPTSFACQNFSNLTHFAQINVRGGKLDTSFDRNSWLTTLAPQLTHCALTLAGSGWHSDLPIIRAMKKIKVMDLFIPDSVGLPLEVIFGIPSTNDAIAATIEYLRVEMTTYKFSRFLQWSHLNRPPPNLKYMKVTVQGPWSSDDEYELRRGWNAVRIELVEAPLGRDYGRRAEFKMLFWDQVERGLN